MAERQARGVLVAGGGFAGAYVARPLKRRGAALVNPAARLPGWFVTRTYHLFQLPLFTRKMRVVTDWTVALLFRRDMAELGTLGRRRGLDER